MDLKEIRGLIKGKDFDSALKLLDKTIDEYPLNENLQFTKAEILFRLKEFEEAFKIIDHITKFGSPAEYWALKAKACEQLSQFQASYDCYDELIGMCPKSKYSFEQGNMKFKLNEFEEALIHYDRALYLNENNLEFLKAKYEVLKKLSRDDESKILNNVIVFLEIDFSEDLPYNILSKLKRANSKLQKNPKSLKNLSTKIFLLIRLEKFQSAINTISEFECKNLPGNEFSKLKEIIAKKLRIKINHLNVVSKELESESENVVLLNQKIALLAYLERYSDLKLFLEDFLKNKPNPKMLLQKMLKKKYGVKNYDMRFVLLEQLTELEPTSEKFLNEQIDILNQLGRYEEALPIIQKMLEMNPEDGRLLRFKIFALNGLGRFAESTPIIERLPEVNPEDEKSLRAKIFALNSLGRFAESMPIIERLLEVNPEDEKSLRTKIFALNSLGRFAESMSIIERLLEVNPEDERSLRTKISTLNSLGRFAESMPVIERLLEMNPEDERSLRTKISALNRLGRFAESMPVIERLLEMNPEDERSLRTKISALNTLGRFAESMSIIERLLEVNPEDEKSLRFKIFALNRLGRYAESLEFVEGLLARRPDDLFLLSKKAHVLVKVSKYSESVNLLEYIFDHYPNNSFNLTSLFARVLHSKLPKGDNHAFIDSKISKKMDGLVWTLVKCKLYGYEQKYNLIKKIIEESPILLNNPEFQKELAFCYESIYETDKAISLYTTILEKYPNDEFSLFGRSQTYIAKRQYDAAIKDLERAYFIHNSIRCKLSMAFILGVTGKYNEAINILTVFSDSIQDSKIILKLKGIIHRKNQHFELSLDCYKQLLAENPNDVDGLTGTALVYEDIEQYDLAINQIDKILEHEGFLLDAMKLKIRILTKIGKFVEAKNNLNMVIQKTSDSQLKTQNDQSDDSIHAGLKLMLEERGRIRFRNVKNVMTKSELVADEIKNLSNSDLKTILQQRESDILEFKSTLRYDTRKKQVNRELELEVMKTICGFLNSQGGCLIVGYSDDKKKCCGLEKDYKSLGKRKDWDGWQQYLESKIKTSMGAAFSGFITMRSNQHEEEGQLFEVAKIMVQKSKRAAYLNINGSNNFFARRNGQTDNLDAKECNQWISDHNLE